MSSELKVGVVVLVAIGIAAYFIIRIEDTGFFETDQTYEVRVRFDNIAGLDRDASVRLAGVHVGRVKEIRLTPDGRAEVTIGIRPDVRLKQDATASVASLGLLGEKYLEVTAGSPGAPVVESGGYIEGGRPVSIDQMVATMNDIAADVQQATQALSNVFGTEAAQVRMQAILENLEAFSADLEVLVASNREAVRGTMANVEALTGSLADSLPSLVADMRIVVQELRTVVDTSEGDVGAAMSNLREVTATLDRSARELEDVMTKVNRGDGTIARLINESDTVDKANAALETIDDSLAAFDTFFNRVGQTRFTFSLRSEFYQEDESTKNYFGVRMGLGPRGDRSFILEVVDDNVGRPEVTSITTDIFDAMGNLIDRQTERREVREQGFGFSALLAQRRGPWQLRGGLIESEAGGGVDYFVADDRWRFTFEAWDFGRDPSPHLKLRGQYHLLDRLFVTAGYDDLLSDDFRQFFIGGGYSFR